MTEQGDSTKRQVAYKVKVVDMLTGRYVKEEGWLPNYVDLGERKVSRANIIGVLVSKDTDTENGSATFVLDDGSARIPLRFFDFSDSLIVGDIVNVIGRPREFGSERYIVPEIVRKVTEPKWVELRKLELMQHQQETTQTMPRTSHADTSNDCSNGTSNHDTKSTSKLPTQISSTGPIVSETGQLIVENEDFSDKINPMKEVYEAIKHNDKGTGVGFDEIIVKTQIDNVDEQIKKLLEQGDIFEIKPGRYKVLE